MGVIPQFPMHACPTFLGDLAEQGRRLRHLRDRGCGQPRLGRGQAIPRARGRRQQHLLPDELDVPPELRQDQVQRLHLQPHPEGAFKVGKQNTGL